MDTKYTTIYMVRHGETHANANEVVGGHTDTELTPKGEAQAKALGEKLFHIEFDQVFSSDLVRAKRTAELILLEKKLVVNTTNLIRERNWGSFEGKTRVEFREQNQELLQQFDQLSEDEKWKFKYGEDFESNQELYDRVILFLREVGATYIGKNILVVSHGGVLRTLLVRFGWATQEQLPTGSIENTSYIVLRTDGSDFFIDEVVGVNKAN
jgi:broad specificity phosphatase PhoE